MQISFLRSSSYNTWDFCQQRYFIEYNLGIKQITNKKAELGNCSHKTLEYMGFYKRALQDKAEFFGDEDLGLMRTDEFDLELIIKKSFDLYVDASVHEYDEADFRFHRNSVYKVIDFQNGLYDPRNLKVVNPEIHFDLLIDKPWAKFEDGSLFGIKGTIDLVVEADENTYEIVDWKTGKRFDWNKGQIKTFSKLRRDSQLLMYYYAAKQLFPDKDIQFTIVYINDGGPFTIPFDEQDLVYAERMIRNRFEEIKANEVPAPLSYMHNNFKCTKLCEYSKKYKGGKSFCQHIHNEIKNKGLEKVTKTYRAKGFDVGDYGSGGGKQERTE